MIVVYRSRMIAILIMKLLTIIRSLKSTLFKSMIIVLSLMTRSSSK